MFNSWWSRLISTLISCRSFASRLDSGSSNKNTFGFRTIALPSATLCRCPPESSFGRRSNKSSIFNIYRAFATKELTKELTNKYKEGIAWGEAKELLFELLEEKISPLRKDYEVLIDDRARLEKILLSGAEKALDVSTPIINKVRQAVGIKGFGD